MTIHIDNRQNIIKLNRRQIRRDMQHLMKELQLHDKEISLVFSDNEGIREINRDYLGRDWPTNVISFAFNEGPFSEVNPQLLGDIIISVEKAAADARDGELPFDDELAFLMIHGLLHLMGYDHEGKHHDKAPLMREKEQDLFSVLRGYRLEP